MKNIIFIHNKWKLTKRVHHAKRRMICIINSTVFFETQNSSDGVDDVGSKVSDDSMLDRNDPDRGLAIWVKYQCQQYKLWKKITMMKLLVET